LSGLCSTLPIPTTVKYSRIVRLIAI